MAQKIENDFSKLTVGAQLTIAHILAFPELGFVTKRMAVMIYDFPSTYENIRTFKGLDSNNLFKTICVGYKTTLPENLKFIGDYPVSSKEKIIDEISYGNRKATLFLGGFAIEEQRVIRLEIIKKLYQTGKLKLSGH